MSWLYSQALVVEYLAASCSDGAPFAPLSGKPTPQAYCAPDRTTAHSRLSRFGMTCAPLTEDRGAELLTWYLAAFHAKTSAQPARVQASKASAVECGQKWPASLARYDHDLRLWKTAQCSLLEGLDVYSETWSRWGTMRGGECWAQLMPVLRTNGSGSGLWPTPTTEGIDGGSNSRKAAKARGMWPTPCATEARQGLQIGREGKKGSQQSLSTMVAFATPQARDFRTGQESRWDNPTKTRNLNDQIGGQLNPTWVEWLMGWPLGWTDLKPLATDKFPQWLRSHGVSWQL